MRRHQERVYAVARRIVRRHDVADDVAQEAFVRAYRSLDRFDLARPFGPWVTRIAANLAVNYVRSPRAREQPLPEDFTLASGKDGTPLQALLDGEAHERIGTALAALNKEQRAVLVLRVFEDLSYQEIAEALGIAIGTVMSRLSRGRERLREALLQTKGST